MPGDKPLPSRCANKVDQAAAYERQINLYLRREHTGNREAQRAIEERQAVESAAESAVREAEQRRLDAERRILELKQKREQAEAEHVRANAAEDLNNESELALIEQQIEKTWKAAAAHSSEARRATAAQRERGQQEIARSV